MALLHQFKVEKGQVTYRSRFLRSDAYTKNSERDRIVMSEFGTLAMPDPCKNFFQRFLSRFEMIGELSLNYVWPKRLVMERDLDKYVTLLSSRSIYDRVQCAEVINQTGATVSVGFLLYCPFVF